MVLTRTLLEHMRSQKMRDKFTVSHNRTVSLTWHTCLWQAPTMVDVDAGMLRRACRALIRHHAIDTEPGCCREASLALAERLTELSDIKHVSVNNGWLAGHGLFVKHCWVVVCFRDRCWVVDPTAHQLNECFDEQRFPPLDVWACLFDETILQHPVCSDVVFRTDLDPDHFFSSTAMT